MGLQSIGSLLPFPEVPQAGGLFGYAGVASYTIDALGEKVSVVFRAPKTGNLAKIWFRVGTITTAQDLKISFEDVDLATGDPDGVVDQYRVMAPGTANSWKQTPLITSDGTDTGAKRAVTIGDYLTAVIEFDTVAGNLQIQGVTCASRVGYLNTCYLDNYLTGGWVRASTVNPMFALEYDDGSVAPIMGAYVFDVSSGAWMNMGTELGTRGKVPFKCRAKGLYFAVGQYNSTSFELRLYASDGTTILASVSHDRDVGTGKGSDVGNVGAWLFSSPVNLNAADIVFVCIIPTGANVTPADSVLASSTLWNACPRSSDWYKVSRATPGSGAFTEATGTIIWAGLILDQLDDGAGGGAGGLLVHPGMSGGMRG